MLSLTKEVYQDEASVAPVLVSACAAELVRLRHGGGGGGVGGRSHLTTVAAPFPDCGPGGADVALPLCWSQSWAAGAGPYSLFNSAASDEPFHLLLQEG